MSHDHHFLLERQQWVGAPLEETFAFFADASNLERLTPPWLGFRILTPLPIDMATGIKIDYTIRMGAVPVRWRTLIAHWNPPHGFVDTQLRGPYALWEHTHGFEPMAGGTLLTDTVRYRLPFGAIGRAVHGLAVRASLSAIFDYRYRRVSEILGGTRGEAPDRGQNLRFTPMVGSTPSDSSVSTAPSRAFHSKRETLARYVPLLRHS